MRLTDGKNGAWRAVFVGNIHNRPTRSVPDFVHVTALPVGVTIGMEMGAA